MLVPPGPIRVLVATKPVDFRKGMDGLAAVVKEQLKADPYHGYPLSLIFDQRLATIGVVTSERIYFGINDEQRRRSNFLQVVKLNPFRLLTSTTARFKFDQ